MAREKSKIRVNLPPGKPLEADPVTSALRKAKKGVEWLRDVEAEDLEEMGYKTPRSDPSVLLNLVGESVPITEEEAYLEMMFAFAPVPRVGALGAKAANFLKDVVNLESAKGMMDRTGAKDSFMKLVKKWNLTQDQFKSAIEDLRGLLTPDDSTIRRLRDLETERDNVKAMLIKNDPDLKDTNTLEGLLEDEYQFRNLRETIRAEGDKVEIEYGPGKSSRANDKVHDLEEVFDDIEIQHGRDPIYTGDNPVLRLRPPDPGRVEEGMKDVGLDTSKPPTSPDNPFTKVELVDSDPPPGTQYPSQADHERLRIHDGVKKQHEKGWEARKKLIEPMSDEELFKKTQALQMEHDYLTLEVEHLTPWPHIDESGLKSIRVKVEINEHLEEIGVRRKSTAYKKWLKTQKSSNAETSRETQDLLSEEDINAVEKLNKVYGPMASPNITSIPEKSAPVEEGIKHLQDSIKQIKESQPSAEELSNYFEAESGRKPTDKELKSLIRMTSPTVRGRGDLPFKILDPNVPASKKLQWHTRSAAGPVGQEHELPRYETLSRKGKPTPGLADHKEIGEPVPSSTSFKFGASLGPLRERFGTKGDPWKTSAIQPPPMIEDIMMKAKDKFRDYDVLREKDWEKHFTVLNKDDMNMLKSFREHIMSKRN